MGSFTLSNVALKNLFSKPATKMYPVLVPEYFDTTRGHISIDIEKCILCSICAKACPTDAIKVEKADSKWSIDGFLCVRCCNCVAKCPKGCLANEKAYLGPTTEKSLTTVIKPAVEESNEVKKEVAEKA